MNIDMLKNIIAICENSGLSSFKFSTDKEKVRFEKRSAENIMNEEYDKERNLNQYSAATVELITDSCKDEENAESFVIVKSEFIGLVSLEESIKEGLTEVKAGDILCVIEAMKIYNNVKSQVDGMIVEILVEDGSIVEFGQDLFKIRV
jgi:acetyl-CoA carboxylase biotin carboxyl carrier protein